MRQDFNRVRGYIWDTQSTNQKLTKFYKLATVDTHLTKEWAYYRSRSKVRCNGESQTNKKIASSTDAPNPTPLLDGGIKYRASPAHSMNTERSRCNWRGHPGTCLLTCIRYSKTPCLLTCIPSLLGGSCLPKYRLTWTTLITLKIIPKRSQVM